MLFNWEMILKVDFTQDPLGNLYLFFFKHSWKIVLKYTCTYRSFKNKGVLQSSLCFFCCLTARFELPACRIRFTFFNWWNACYLKKSALGNTTRCVAGIYAIGSFILIYVVHFCNSDIKTSTSTSGIGGIVYSTENAK